MAASVYTQEYYINSLESPHPPVCSLIHDNKYVNIPIQTSRRGPYQGDGYDIIQHSGKRYRTKSIEQILQELQNTHVFDAHMGFSSNDNFLGNIRFAKELLKPVNTSNFSLAFTFFNFWNYQ